LDDSPAASTDLSPKDVVMAVDGKGFSGKPFTVFLLVDRLEKAACRKSAQASLTVLRGGRARKVKVSFPRQASHSRSCPVKCPRCEALAEKALIFLCKTQKADGSWGQVTGGQNGQVAVAAMAGLAFLAQGSTLETGTYSKELGRAAAFVQGACVNPQNLMGRSRSRSRTDANWNQENWKWGYAGMFLAEVYHKTPRPEIRKTLNLIVLKIEKNQEPSGGWAHGPGGPNALGYLELEIVSNYVLTALGCAKKIGLAIDEEKVKKAFDYIVATGGGDGGVGYSTRRGQQGHGDPGRTAGAIVAFLSLEQGWHPFVGKMKKFLLRRMDKLPMGHVSPMMHLWFGSLACHNLGKRHVSKYWGYFRLHFFAASRPDGAFDSWPTAESEQLRRNSDRSMGLPWSTAHLVLPLLLPLGHLSLVAPQKK